ncbi:MAG: hypothetical protein LBP42_02270 [Treponema sp.]|jgi:hypothetical protein|nr:hypothetical protein [Treponema sp.]
MKIEKGPSLSPIGMFIIYLLSSSVIILGFRFIFPPENAPLPNFSFHWRLIGGVREIAVFFPALAMSALVIPFGFKNIPQGEFTPFSPRFLEYLRVSVFLAITAASIYGILSLLVFPLAENDRINMRFEGHLFHLAKDQAVQHGFRQEWPEAARFIAVCERIWPNSPDIEYIRTETDINMEVLRVYESEARAEELYHINNRETPVYRGISGQRDGVNVVEALEMTQNALREERYYDAHWLATLASRLARPDSVEFNTAMDLASRAWNAISSLEPNAREVRAYNHYRLKREAYEAMIAGDWIQAYFIFKNISNQASDDPDVVNFLKICEEGVNGIAFFIDDMDLTLGEILTEAVFSLPAKSSVTARNGRFIMRINSLSVFEDYSYGIGLELLALGGDGRLLYHVEAPYVKLLPVTLDFQPRIILIMRAFDRNNSQISWEPLWSGPERSSLGETQIMLDLAYEDFLLLAKAKQGIDRLLITDLFNAEKKLGSYGYAPQVFQAEIIYRIFEPASFLSIAILSLIIGWRYRAKKQPAYVGLPMLIVSPMIFNATVHFYRNALNTLAIRTVISFGLFQSLIIFGAGVFIIFIGMLIFLAAQHD